MNIAKLWNRLELFQPVLTDDGYGGKISDWQSAGKVWGEMKRTNYAEMQAQGTPMSREQLRFTIRPRRDIQRGWLLEYAGEKYLIDVADNTYRDSTTLIVRRYEQGV